MNFASLGLVLPPAEVFSFTFHTALTELVATSDDGKLRDKVNRDGISSEMVLAFRCVDYATYRCCSSSNCRAFT